MDNTLYLECYSGISGDMMVAALLDLGADRRVLDSALKSLKIDGFSTEITRVKKAGLDVCDFRVILNVDNHDHDMDYLHGKEHSHENVDEVDHTHTHGHHDHHTEDHMEDHMHHHHTEDHANDHYMEDHDHIHSKDVNIHDHNMHDHNMDDHDHDHHVDAHDHVHNTDIQAQDNNTNGHTHDIHTHAGHTHEHRGLPEIIEIINQAEITYHAKEIAKRIFQIIAEAEAKAHGATIENVHFHEVGAVDSIVDIISIAVCLDNLDIKDVIVPEIYEGRGFVRCQHGIIPIPVPAVANIAAAYDLQLHITETEGELVTPTGAAIVAAIRTKEKLPKKFSINKIGIGAGKRTYDRPSMLRAMLIQDKTLEEDSIIKLESNIDDCSGETLGFVMERLFEAGARDVHYIPVFMKKNRPAYQLNVICDDENVKTMEQIIFKETTTIGIRRVTMERTVLKREIKKVQTSLGEVKIKICMLDSEKRYYPEYNSVEELCKKHNLSYQDVYYRIISEIKGVI